jgi:hypothetical protein
VDKVTVSSIADSKPSFVVSNVVAASPTLGSGELAIWAGTDAKDANQGEVIVALRRLAERFREEGFPVGPLANNMAHFTVPGGPITFLNHATFPGGMTEKDVMIAYEEDFYSAGNSSNMMNIIKRAIEVYKEQILKPASTGVHAFASGVLTGTTIDADDTVTIAGVEYTFLAVPLVADDIDVGADDEESLDNLIAAINAAEGEGTKYGTGTVINPDARAVAGAGDTMDVIARLPGTAGNAITTTAVLTAGDFAEATLLGGL